MSVCSVWLQSDESPSLLLITLKYQHIILPCLLAHCVCVCLYDSAHSLSLFPPITSLLLTRSRCAFLPHLQLLLSLQGKLFERLDDDSRVGAVVHKNGRAPHPRLQVVDGQRDVLGVVLRKRRREGITSEWGIGERGASCYCW